jgi:hypothetical protein
MIPAWLRILNEIIEESRKEGNPADQADKALIFDIPEGLIKDLKILNYLYMTEDGVGEKTASAIRNIVTENYNRSESK